MAINIADYLASNPSAYTIGLMPYDPNTQPRVAPGISIGTMPYDPNTQPRTAPGITIGTQPVVPGQYARPVPVAGPPPPLVGNGQYHPTPGIYHPELGTGYAPGGKNMYNTPFVRDYVSPLLPQGEFQRTLGQQRMADANTRRGQFGLSQYADAQRKYQAAQLRSPGLSFRDFLAKGGAGDLMRSWRGLSASARGLNPASRSSVIRLG